VDDRAAKIALRALKGDRRRVPFTVLVASSRRLQRSPRWHFIRFRHWQAFKITDTRPSGTSARPSARIELASCVAYGSRSGDSSSRSRTFHAAPRRRWKFGFWVGALGVCLVMADRRSTGTCGCSSRLGLYDRRDRARRHYGSAVWSGCHVGNYKSRCRAVRKLFVVRETYHFGEHKDYRRQWKEENQAGWRYVSQSFLDFRPSSRPRERDAALDPQGWRETPRDKGAIDAANHTLPVPALRKQGRQSAN
jgi:hypothetical protein